MMTGVPYLPEKRIERDAAALLAEFEQVRSVQINPPVPIDDIIEKHLKLGSNSMTCTNYSEFRVPILFEPDILGAIFLDERRIVIDEYLDPEENPSQEGRYRFTLAHEAGHWRLHRDLFANDQMQISMFDKPVAPAMICRSSEARKREEWQADFYASCLLMPQKLLMTAWNEMFPDGKPRVVQPCIPIDHPFVEVPRAGMRDGRFGRLQGRRLGSGQPRPPACRAVSRITDSHAHPAGKARFALSTRCRIRAFMTHA